MGERARKAAEYGLGGLLGVRGRRRTMGLGHDLLQTTRADPMLLWIALVGALSRYPRFEFLRRARRWEELVPLVRELVEDAEWINGFDHRVTMDRRAAVDARRMAGRRGAAHPVTANEVAEALRQAARDPALAESVRQMVRRAVPQDQKRCRRCPPPIPSPPHGRHDRRPHPVRRPPGVEALVLRS